METGEIGHCLEVGLRILAVEDDVDPDRNGAGHCVALQCRKIVGAKWSEQIARTLQEGKKEKKTRYKVPCTIIPGRHGRFNDGSQQNPTPYPPPPKKRACTYY